ncbi:MAG: GGDEF domain-containing protein [Clostridiales bacterium]|jgi:diguanylate cyclase (GGDEF)-like protein|nr:GGDEF domain-containing protein [Clostridiales bacterium]
MPHTKLKLKLRTLLFYTLDETEYRECMNKSFSSNLHQLYYLNMLISVLTACFSFFPVLVEGNYIKARIYIVVSVVALTIGLFSRRAFGQVKRGEHVSKSFIYTLTAQYYTNIMLFGMYIGIWSSPDRISGSFLGFLICALFVLINPPVFNLCLTLSALIIFIISSVITKSHTSAVFDTANALIAALISILLTWWITKLRLALISNELKLERERNKYYSQSTVDELTRLKNRRDFEQTFERYSKNYRSSDEWLCLAILDVDFFKEYNDCYGHPMGDVVLRSIGTIFNSLTDSSGVYAARIGGEEFAMLWFEKTAERADLTVNKVFESVAGLNIEHEKSAVAKILTVSIGVCISKCGSERTAISVMYAQADKALYKAKTGGRARAVVSCHETEEYTIIPDGGFASREYFAAR